MSNNLKNVLVTGAGGIAGVNFIRAIKLESSLHIFGAEQNDLHKIYAENIEITDVPSPLETNYIEKLNDIITNLDISFLHPQPTPELQVIAKNRDNLEAKLFLPETSTILKDKSEQNKILHQNNISVTKTFDIKNLDDLENFNNFLTFPVWVRAKKGAGGRLSIKCNSINEIKLWIELCVEQKRAKIDEFIIQEFLDGRDIAFDSLWYNGKLIISYCRERLEYPFSKLTMSGITGTPTISKIIHDENINKICVEAVKKISNKPHGCFSIDLKEDKNGKPFITEVDSGKFHTTIGLWGFLAEKNLKLPWYYNMPRLYTHLGMGGEIPVEEQIDIYPKNLYLFRNLDCGAWIRLNGVKSKVL